VITIVIGVVDNRRAPPRGTAVRGAVLPHAFEHFFSGSAELPRVRCTEPLHDAAVDPSFATVWRAGKTEICVDVCSISSEV
jgi:hypothetical protein